MAWSSGLDWVSDGKCHNKQAQMLHGTGIFTYTFGLNVGEYSTWRRLRSSLDPSSQQGSSSIPFEILMGSPDPESLLLMATRNPAITSWGW